MSTPLCESYPSVFSSPYLADFDELGYREDNKIENILIDERKPKTKKEKDSVKAEYELELDKNKSIHQLKNIQATVTAKEICAQCPLLAQCKERNVNINTRPTDIYGVVGGMTLRERNAALRLLKKQRTEALHQQTTVKEILTSISVQEKNRLAARLLSS